MYVSRGAATSPDKDRSAMDRLVATVAETGEPGVRVWYPPVQVSFGRRDCRAAGYDRARRVASAHGYPPTERRTGGRAVAFTGSVLAMVRVSPAEPGNPAIDARYEQMLTDLETALSALGVDSDRGEPSTSFCPGGRSLSAGGKLAGLAQRVRSGVAVVAGILIIADVPAFGSILSPVYDALEVPFDPDSVGSLAAVGCQAEPGRVRGTVEASLIGDANTPVRHVRDT